MDKIIGTLVPVGFKTWKRSWSWQLTITDVCRENFCELFNPT